MRDFAKVNYHDNSISASLRRLRAWIGRHLTRGERRVGFCINRGADGEDYIHPAPNGAIPMAKRRLLNVKGR